MSSFFEPSLWEGEWYKDAACAKWDVDPEIFALRKRGAPSRINPDPWTEARKVCGRCPVRNQCLEDVLASDPTGDMERYELFQGGLTPGELTVLRRRRMRKVNV